MTDAPVSLNARLGATLHVGRGDGRGDDGRGDDAPVATLLVDDEPVVRAGLRAFLERHAGLRVVGEADGLTQARAWLHRAAGGERCTPRPGHETPSTDDPSEPPELVILDLKLRDGTGTELIPDVRRLAPRAKILILSSFPEEDAVRAAMESGAHGWLNKQQDPSALADAVRASLRGELPRPAEAVRSRAAPPRSDPFEALTPRERQVLDGIADGQANREIAEHLGLREKTVKTHASSIYAKLGVERRTQAALLAREHGVGGQGGHGDNGLGEDGPALDDPGTS